MLAQDVMTTKIVSVRPDTSVMEISKLLLAHQISAVPVVRPDGRLIGMVSEGDLMRRPENDTISERSWWLQLFASPHDSQLDFVKTHGKIAEQVMTKKPLTVSVDTSLAEVAEILEKNQIKRVPVMNAGKMVGIVSRANLLHGLVTAMPTISEPNLKDRDIRKAVVSALESLNGINANMINVIVKDGKVQLWGIVDDDTAHNAVIVAAELIDGVGKVESHLGRMPSLAYGI